MAHGLRVDYGRYIPMFRSIKRHYPRCLLFLLSNEFKEHEF